MHHLPTGTVTLLFTDIEESTHLLEQLGERYTDVLAVYRSLLRTAFHTYGGHEVDTQGDAFFIAFTRATDAVSAAAAAQHALAASAWPNGVTVHVRMGLHTGEPQLSAEGYVGLDVHHAARIMHAGHGGQILLSQTTRDLVEHDLPEGASLRDLGAHRLKDLEHPNHLYQLITLGLPADFPPLKTLDSYAHNLPGQLTPLIGRAQEIAAIQHLLQRQEMRLLTLTGPGGIGKTRLGLQVAAELNGLFADGIYFVNLAPISDPELVVPTIAQTLGVKEAAGQPLLDLLSAWLREKELLLLLDNFEQVVGAAVEMAKLLARCPRLKVLVTSRAVLHVRGEQEFAVPPLAVPDPKDLPDLVTLSQYEAVALFISRAQAIKPEFQVTNANALAIAEICVRLDGLPLAIELAAARIKLLPSPALLSRLEHRLQVLTSGAQDAPRRQQTLRNTIAWSYDLLDADEQRLFRRLSVFAGGCTLQAIEAVCAALDTRTREVSLLDAVTSLIDKSLLQQTEQEGDEPRFVMLETIREYGLECLATSGQMEAVRRVHATYYLRLSEEGAEHLHGSKEGRWFDQVEQEYDNLRVALNWLIERREAEMALRLGAALCGFWLMRGYYNEGCQWLAKALSGSEEVAPSVRAEGLNGLGMLELNMGNFNLAQEQFAKSLVLYRELGNKQGIADTLNMLGHLGWVKRQYAGARSLIEESLILQRELENQWGIAWALSNFASIALNQGEYLRARALSEEALALFRQLGDEGSIGYAYLRLVEAAVSQGVDASSYTLAEECLAACRAGGDKGDIAQALDLLGRVILYQGDAEAARSLFEESLALCQELGSKWTIAHSHTHLANLTASQGDYPAALALYKEGLALYIELDDKQMIAVCLEGLANIVAIQGELIRAARLWGVAEALREAIDAPLPPVERANYERSVAAAFTQLGEKTFAAAWAEGRIMSWEQALAARGQVTVSAEPQSTSSAKLLPTYPDGLTAREMEVLRLVAQGLSNAEIADQLIISLLTVKAHMRSLYNKLGISSRSAATRYAIEHHLL